MYMTIMIYFITCFTSNLVSFP